MNKQQLRSYLAEFTVIVLGILLAFQVEEWREERAERRDVAAAMKRLMEETEENVQRCESFSELLKANAQSVRHVYLSLAAGEIIDDDRHTFELGLINFGVVPDVRMLTSAANEMISTGLLKELDDSVLRGSIARLPALDSEARDLLAYWRAPIIALGSEIAEIVDFSYVGELPSFDRSPSYGESMESRMRVDYDFQELSSSRLIRNRFFEAVDVHADLWVGFQQRCEVVDEIRTRLKGAINPSDQ